MKKINNTNTKDGSRLCAAPLNSTTHLTRLCHTALKGASALALTLALASEGRAQTTVCGTISGQTWTKANSPYLVTCDLMVVTLTIQPGVRVIFQGNYGMEVAGRLTAVGTAQDNIVFSAASANVAGWKGIYFNQAPPGSKLVYCVVSNATDTALTLKDSAPGITNCTFVGNSSLTKAGAISANIATDTLVLEDCDIVGNSSVGEGAVFTSMGTENLVVRNCRIFGNSSKLRAESCDGGGLGVSLLGSNTLQMSGCIVSSNIINGLVEAGILHGGGVSVESDKGGALLEGCSFAQNRCFAKSVYGSIAGATWGGGVYFSSNGRLVMRNCLVVSNSCINPYDTGEWNVAFGGGLNASAGTARIENCIFLGNTASAPNNHAGGGINLGSFTDSRQASMDVVNTTLANNVPDAFYCNSGSSLRVSNSIAFFNSPHPQFGGVVATVAYSCVQGGYAGTGNISFNPLLAAPSLGDVHLIDGSPCIDAGNPAAAFNDACFPPSFGPLQGYTVRNDMGAYGGPGACNWAQCDAPTIASQPQGQSSCLGQSATFCVTASGVPPLNYQWRFNGSPISGKTNDCLTLVNLQSSNAGPYSVVVSSACGSVTSSVAPLVVNDACVDLCMYAGLNIAGLPGRTYELRYTTDLSNTNFATWTFLATNTVPWFYIDTTSCGVPKRFYGVKLRP